MLTPQRPPPEDYYQNNCRTLFAFVRRRYADVLPVHYARQLDAFMTLSDGAQRLFARILTRKGPWLRLDSLTYAEVDDESHAIRELGDGGFVTLQPDAPGDALLSLLRKDELLALVADDVRGVRGKRKAELIALLLDGRTDQQVRARVARHAVWLEIMDPRLWWLMRLLYFGDTQQDWSSFVIRDLGMVSYEPVALEKRHFRDAESLHEDLRLRYLSALSHRLDEQPELARELMPALQQVSPDRFAARRRERALLRIGHWLERREKHDDALAAYGAARRHPARERAIRILHKRGRTLEAHIGMQAIREAPTCEEEYQFTERFGRRNGGFQPEHWVVPIDHAEPAIELQAIEVLKASGAIAWGAHVENSLVRTLTGLLYWRAIFSDVHGAFSNPFQSGPNDLYFDDFALARRQIIDEIEHCTRSDEALRSLLRQTAQTKWGVANTLVSWGLLERVPLDDLLETIPLDHIRRLGHFMIRNLPHRRRGFPDLLVAYGPDQYEFLEVKGPNDQLQPAQRVWLRHLQRLRVPARVLRLKLRT